MTQSAYVDDKRLSGFAGHLAGFSRHVDRDVDLLLQELGRLSRTWQDESFEEFNSHVRRLAQEMLAFSQVSDHFSAHLQRKAEEAAQIHRGNIEP